MKALTLYQPWAWAIVAGKKVVENRPWKPHASVIGEIVAIHAGKTYDEDGEKFLASKGVVAPGDVARVHGAIVGVARVVGFIERDNLVDRSDPAYSDPMFFGPFGWKLADIRMLSMPVRCKGALGLWNVPLGSLTLVERQLAEAA